MTPAVLLHCVACRWPSVQYGHPRLAQAAHLCGAGVCVRVRVRVCLFVCVCTSLWFWGGLVFAQAAHLCGASVCAHVRVYVCVCVCDCVYVSVCVQAEKSHYVYVAALVECLCTNIA